MFYVVKYCKSLNSSLELNIAIIVEIKNVVDLIHAIQNHLLNKCIAQITEKHIFNYILLLPTCTEDPFSYSFYPPYLKSSNK